MKGPVGKLARCAIYTRKSSEHNLDLEFNSLDAQREACEAYIKSQAHEGWRLIPSRYDDGAFSGASLDRPALPVRACSLVSSLLLNGATMSQESSLTQSPHSFPQVLTAYTPQRRAKRVAHPRLAFVVNGVRSRDALGESIGATLPGELLRHWTERD